jgi:DNA-binding transcriptional LysR family regulator
VASGAISESIAHDLISLGVSGQRGFLPLRGPDGVLRLTQRPWLMANEFSFVRALVVQGLGIGSLLGGLARPEIEAKRLEHVLPDYGLDDGGLYAVYPSRQHLTPKVRVFVDHLAEHLELGG